MAEDELVVVVVAGVQPFIAGSRTTADLGSASAIIQRLSMEIASSLKEDGADLIFPGGFDGKSATGITNRIVAEIGAGRGVAAAEKAQVAVTDYWKKLLQNVYRGAAKVPETPGFPIVRWVVQPIDQEGEYRQAWEGVNRQFSILGNAPSWKQLEQRTDSLKYGACQLTPSWPAIDEKVRPTMVPNHETSTRAAANWVKFCWNRVNDEASYPSTRAIATAFSRQEIIKKMETDQELLGLVSALKECAEPFSSGSEQPVPMLASHSGPPAASWMAGTASQWLRPNDWTKQSIKASSDTADEGQIRNGAQAQKRFAEALKTEKITLPSYLAIVMQDIDSLGNTLQKEAQSAQRHREISAELASLAAKHKEITEKADVGGVCVYSGGDDLLSLVPACTAIAAARQAHGKVLEREFDELTASTAVVFFHGGSPLHVAVAAAQELLEESKQQRPGKNTLGISVLAHSGAETRAFIPWDEDFEPIVDLFLPSEARPFSPNIVWQLRYDQDNLDDLSVAFPVIYQEEIKRLVYRHTTEAELTAKVIEKLGELPYRDGASQSEVIAATIKAALAIQQEAYQ